MVCALAHKQITQIRQLTATSNALSSRRMLPTSLTLQHTLPQPTTLATSWINGNSLLFSCRTQLTSATSKRLRSSSTTGCQTCPSSQALESTLSFKQHYTTRQVHHCGLSSTTGRLQQMEQNRAFWLTTSSSKQSASQVHTMRSWSRHICESD